MPRVTFLGHSAVSIEGGGKTVLVDPFLTGNPKASTTADAVNADYVVLTHAHGDHFGDTIAIAKRTGATVIANFEIANYCQERGCTVHHMHLGGAFEFDFGRVKLTVAHHGSSFPDGTYGGDPGGVIFTMDGKKIHHVGDTALTHDLSFAGDEGLDLALVPIGDNFTMGPDDALRSLDLLRPKRVVPVHYDTWPPIEQDAAAWAARCEAKGVPATVLAPGEWLDV